jgi:divalent metal cation (Fe/Co/Zn/Cd) transporter
MVIFQQGLGILQRSYTDIIDAGLSQSQLQKIMKHLDPLTSSSSIHSFSDIRGRTAGAMTFIDMTANVDKKLTVGDSWTLEDKIRNTLKAANNSIAEVNVRFKPVSNKAH